MILVLEKRKGKWRKTKPSRWTGFGIHTCCGLGRQLRHVACLGALLPLNDLELHVITLLETLIAFIVDSAVVDEDIGSVIAADEAEPFGIVKPLNFSFNTRHLLFPPCFGRRTRGNQRLNRPTRFLAKYTMGSSTCWHLGLLASRGPQVWV